MKAIVSKYDDETGVKSSSISFDDDDLWSLDHTLSLIIVECLKKFKELPNAHGVENDDLPDHLKIIGGDFRSCPFENAKKAWNWVLDEMIFAHQEIASGENFNSYDRNYQDRISNGLRLFGKYYQALWI